MNPNNKPNNKPIIQAHFESIISLPAVERGDALDRLALAPAERAELAALLSAHDHAGRFLAHPTADLPTAEKITEAAGQLIGPYKLLQLIGEGGFGSVFMAEQEAPVRRRVALKIIKLGMDTRQVVARFEQERQALAIMDHPHIAKVFDAGATPTGRPFFVMEYVKGRPITDYADAERLTLRARLDLFLQVCRAVQHAHMKGVIHRDLKPRNVLVSTVDGRPAAKVIDFGIAKATGQRMTEKTLFTEHHALIGTPEYMSPEQAEGSIDIDTRTDVYSLGVLLYELLTGTTPIDSTRLRSAAFNEMVRLIREIEPPSPSVRVTAQLPSRREGQGVGSPFASPAPSGGGGRVREAGGGASAVSPSQREGAGGRVLSSSTHSPTHTPAWGSSIKGELDWIVMKCLDKDRSRRYATPDALAEDLQRHLTGEPVVAAPPSRGYLLKKFVKRHKGPVLAGTAVGLALMVGMAGTAWQWTIADSRLDAFATSIAFMNGQLNGYEPQQSDKDRWRSHLLQTGDSPEEVLNTVGYHAVDTFRRQANQRANDLQLAMNNLKIQTDAAERNAYSSSIALTQLAIESNDLSQARDLLDSAQPDLRGWEWHEMNSGVAAGIFERNAPEGGHFNGLSGDGRVTFAIVGKSDPVLRAIRLEDGVSLGDLPLPRMAYLLGDVSVSHDGGVAAVLLRERTEDRYQFKTRLVAWNTMDNKVVLDTTSVAGIDEFCAMRNPQISGDGSTVSVHGWKLDSNGFPGKSMELETGSSTSAWNSLQIITVSDGKRRVLDHSVSAHMLLSPDGTHAVAEWPDIVRVNLITNEKAPLLPVSDEQTSWGEIDVAYRDSEKFWVLAPNKIVEYNGTQFVSTKSLPSYFGPSNASLLRVSPDGTEMIVLSGGHLAHYSERRGWQPFGFTFDTDTRFLAANWELGTVTVGTGGVMSVHPLCTAVEECFPSELNANSVSMSSKGRIVAAISKKALVVSDLSKGVVATLQAELPSQALATSISPDESKVAVLGEHELLVASLDINDLRVLHRVNIKMGHAFTEERIVWSRPGTPLVAVMNIPYDPLVSRRSHLCVVDHTSGIVIDIVTIPQRVDHLFWDPDGESLWSAGKPGLQRIWSRSGKPVLGEPLIPTECAALSNEGTQLVAALSDRIQVLKWPDLTVNAEWENHSGVGSVRWLQGTHRIVTEEGIWLRVIDPASGRSLWRTTTDPTNGHEVLVASVGNVILSDDTVIDSKRSERAQSLRDRAVMRYKVRAAVRSNSNINISADQLLSAIGVDQSFEARLLAEALLSVQQKKEP